LNGVVSQATSLIRNRGWSMTGGKIQVNRTKEIFHDADRQCGGRFGDGYRRYITRMARSFYIASFGAISELGRDAAAQDVWLGSPLLDRCGQSGPLTRPI
jgi:hypothetical protein